MVQNINHPWYRNYALMHTEQKKKHCVPLFLFKLAQQFINLTLFFLVQLHQASDQPPPIVPRKSLSIAESVSLPNMYVKTPMKAQKAGLFVFTFRYLMLQWFWYLEQQWPKIRKLKYYVNFNLFFSFLPPKKKKKKARRLSDSDHDYESIEDTLNPPHESLFY